MSARFAGSKKAWVFFLFLVGGLVGLPAAFAQNGEMGTADLNHDSFVDANDLLEFHTQWQTGGTNVPVTNPAEQIASVITAVTIPADNKPEVAITLTDGTGAPIQLSALKRAAFTIARIVEDNLPQNRTHYQSYLFSTSDDGPFGPTPQPTFDNGTIAANLTDLGGGNFRYKFAKTVVVAPTETHLTHTIGAQIHYDLDGDGRLSYANPLFHFRPDGLAVTTLRELSDTQTCNNCHNPLAIHGGGRREFGLCILCHYPGIIDADTGATVDMAAMIHQIHISHNFQNAHNASGTAHDGINSVTPYVVIGFNNGVHDYSLLTYPQDIRNCKTCHTGSVDKAGEQAEYYEEVPSRRACSGCHDKVNFATGEGHGPGAGFPQADDNSCAACHQPTGAEFGQSIEGAHTIPSKSTLLPKVVCKLLNVANAAAGATPTVTFSLATVVGGVTTTLTDLTGYSVTVTMAGPTSDYEFDKGVSVTNANSVDNGNGTRSITPGALMVPADFTGTLAFAMSARGPSITVDSVAPAQTARAAADNPVVYVEVTKALEPRRQVIDWNKCLKCHSVLALHGSNRNNYEYCVMCHRPASDDEFRRNPDDMPPVSVDFKYMIHKIHTGEELTKDYTVFGFRSSPASATNPVNYNEVTFPGDRRDCDSCHLPGTYGVPAVAGATDTVVTQETGGVGVVLHLEPSQAACTGCHDSDASLSHTQSLIDLNGGVENCAECHGPSREWAVNKVHHRGL